jgi:hypothetical protein
LSTCTKPSGGVARHEALPRLRSSQTTTYMVTVKRSAWTP